MFVCKILNIELQFQIFIDHLLSFLGQQTPSLAVAAF